MTAATYRFKHTQLQNTNTLIFSFYLGAHGDIYIFMRMYNAKGYYRYSIAYLNMNGYISYEWDYQIGGPHVSIWELLLINL